MPLLCARNHCICGKTVVKSWGRVRAADRAMLEKTILEGENMKKLIALLLAMILLLAASALAEELPYIWQLPQYNYVRTTLMTEESYPEVRLTNVYPFQLCNSNPVEPLFVCFPGPVGATISSFDSYSAHYLDVDNLIQYTYVEDESNSFEETLRMLAEAVS